MEDIAPALLEQLKELYKNEKNSSEKIIEILDKLREKNANFVDASEYANELGEILSKVFGYTFSVDVLPDGKMYYNIAKRTVEPTMKDLQSDIADLMEELQENVNKKAGLGIKPLRPELNQDKIDGIINRLAEAENFDDIKWILREPIKTFARSVVDDAILVNAEFQGKAGLAPKIIRKSSGNCCKWCTNLVGEYNYPNVPKDVYRRHNRCRCTVDFVVGKRKQNVWNKSWEEEVDEEKIAERKAVPYGEKEQQATPEKKTQESIMQGYEKRRLADNLNLSPISELLELQDDIFGVNLGNLDTEIKDNISTQIEKLLGKYKSTLQKVSVARREDMIYHSGAYGWNAFSQQMYSSEITFAPYKKEKLLEKLRKSVEYGWCTYVNEEDYLKYTVTHEFGHTLLNMKAGTKNFVNADEKLIKESQRKIKKIYGEYKEEVQTIKGRLATIESAMENESDFEKIMEIMEQYDKEKDILDTVLISEYSLADADEFLAEAFTQNEIGVNKSKYTERVMEVIKQNFMW